MTFLWPTMLFSLLAVPVVVLLYLRVQRRRRVLSKTFESFGKPPTTRARGPGFRRHIPPLLFLVSLVILLVALARPQAEISLPRVEGTVMLVFDVSYSMAAQDAEPTRLAAAKTAAQEFVLSQPETVKIGIVSFSSSGFSVQSPTNDPNALTAAIERLKPENGTSLGQGISVALNAIAVDAGLPPAPTPAPSSEDASREQNPLDLLPEGPYPPSVIVLLSDGENDQSVDPLEAAKAAFDRGVRVDALGFGTPGGSDLEVKGSVVHTALDEPALQSIVQVAGGTYYNAQNEADPRAVYANLTPELVIKPEKMEITSVFTGASLLVLLLGAVFSIVWFNRLP
mgnify:CR=1 FL=1